MARSAPLVARSTATRHSRAESPERRTRASRETDGADFVLKFGDGEEIFEQIYTGQMTVRDSPKFVQNFVRQKIAAQTWQVCAANSLRTKFCTKKNYMGDFWTGD